MAGVGFFEHQDSDIKMRVQILTGQENFQRWRRDIKFLAQARDLWDLMTGEEEILPEPRKEDYYRPAKRSNDGAMAGSSSIKPSPRNDVAAILEFGIDKDEWRRQQKRLREAKGIIGFSIEPNLRAGIADHDTPEKCLEFLERHYRMANSHIIDMAYAKIEKLQLSDCQNAQDLFNQLKGYSADITEAGGTYTDAMALSKLRRSFPASFDSFFDAWHTFHDEFDDEEKDDSELLFELQTQLLRRESIWREQAPVEGTTDHAEKGKQKKDKSQSQQPGSQQIQKDTNRDEKKKTDEKPDRKELICTHKSCGKKGHAEKDCWIAHPEKSYKKDLVCTYDKCGRRGHTEKSCWFAHPEKQPDWSKKNN